MSAETPAAQGLVERLRRLSTGIPNAAGVTCGEAADIIEQQAAEIRRLTEEVQARTKVSDNFAKLINDAAGSWDELKARAEQAERRLEDRVSQLTATADALAASEARVRVLTAALEPFAKRAEDWSVVDDPPTSVLIPLNNLRRARAALKGEP